MKKTVIIFVLSCLALAGIAAPRNASQAVAIAKQWTRSTRKANPKLSSAASTPSSVALADSSLAYFVVNTLSGFVIVSSDDAMPTILGYSNEGTFDPNNLPEGLRDLLASYDTDFLSLPVLSAAPLTTQTLPKEVEPLLTTKWNQRAPYNDLCPLYDNKDSRCVSGCVAAAMAQVMRYHNCPVKGSGSHSYLWLCKETPELSKILSASFDITYDWANMLPSYSSGYTKAQGAAVATLMYHCGVSIDMGYGATSGAQTKNVMFALRDYFGYDSNTQRICKDMYPMDSLCAIVRHELDNARPVIADGYNEESGHAFVCDGYDALGYFHFNWGWGGSSDGYYLLSALNPGSQGVGGSSHGYNKNTAFYIGIQPKTASSQPAIPQMAAEKSTISKVQMGRNERFDLSLIRLENKGITDFTGSYGVALYDEDETQLVTILAQKDNYTLHAGYYRTTEAILSCSIPKDLPVGTYHLCAVYKDANYGWMRLLCTQDDYYRTLYITDSQITVYDNNAPASISLTQAISFPNPDSVPITGAPLYFAMKNEGGTFSGQISARIYKGNFAKGQYELMDSVIVRRNQSLASALQQNFDPNLLLNTPYKMKLCWRVDNADSWHNFEPADSAQITFVLYDSTPVPPTPTDRFIPKKYPESGMKIVNNNQLFILKSGVKYSIIGQIIEQ